MCRQSTNVWNTNIVQNKVKIPYRSQLALLSFAIAIAFLVSGTRDGGWMLAGAMVAGLATAMLTQVLRGAGGVAGVVAVRPGAPRVATEALVGRADTRHATPCHTQSRTSSTTNKKQTKTM